MKSRMDAMTLAARLTALSLSALTASPSWAQTNPEDEPLSDENVPAVASPTPVITNDSTDSSANSDSADTSSTTPENQDLSDSDAPPSTSSTRNPSSTSAASASETVTISRAEWEQLQRDVAELKAARGTTTSGTTTSGATGTETTGGEAGATPVSNNALKLPDISLVLQAKGLLSSDRRDEDRTRLNLSEAELAIQGFVYPNVRADAFIVGAPAEDAPFQLEEGFLTFLGVRKGLNINVGRKFAPFGRTGELHNHSWLYPRQLLPIRNLVAEEALVGDGVNFNYLFPTKGSLFVRGSLGFFSGEGTESQFNLGDTSNPFFDGLPSGTGAGFTRRFINARLWAGHPIGQNGELEIGLSHARGTSEIADDADNILGGNVRLSGADVSYRRFMGGGKRLLLRSEYFVYQPKGGLPTRRASGYYALADMRLNPYQHVGLLYEKSGFPQAPGRSESALSLILTKQLTEQFYVRLMGTRGERPGGSYNELRLQFTAGLGPHTHSLE